MLRPDAVARYLPGHPLDPRLPRPRPARPDARRRRPGSLADRRHPGRSGHAPAAARRPRRRRRGVGAGRLVARRRPAGAAGLPRRPRVLRRRPPVPARRRAAAARSALPAYAAGVRGDPRGDPRAAGHRPGGPPVLAGARPSLRPDRTRSRPGDDAGGSGRRGGASDPLVAVASRGRRRQARRGGAVRGTRRGPSGADAHVRRPDCGAAVGPGRRGLDRRGGPSAGARRRGRGVVRRLPRAGDRGLGPDRTAVRRRPAPGVPGAVGRSPGPGRPARRGQRLPAARASAPATPAGTTARSERTPTGRS